MTINWGRSVRRLNVLHLCRLALLSDSFLYSALVLLELVIKDLLGQALGQVTSLVVLLDHVTEATLHFGLNAEGLTLDIFHLLLDGFNTLLEDCWVESACLIEHGAHAGLHGMHATHGSTTSVKGAGLHD
jgi:hypothetical protein